MDNRVVLAGEDGGLELHDPSFEDELGLREGRDYWMECDVTAYAPSARHMTHLTMIEPYRADLLGFFTDLAKGVDHSRWRAEHAEMSAEAVAKGDRYRLDIAILGPPPLSRDDRLSLSATRWECRRFARDLKRFLRGDDPLRITDEQ